MKDKKDKKCRLKKRRSINSALAALVLLCCLLTGCGAGEAPEKHFISPPDAYPTAQDEYGADAFAGSLDDAQSGYFMFNDFYHARSAGKLHILEQFETYQQTTEYTCGAASSLMVLHYFGVDDYDELLLAERMDADETHGITVEGVRDFFLSIGWDTQAHAETEPFFADEDAFALYVTEQIDSGVPILVNWEDWGGHWQVIIGIDTGRTDSPYDDVLVLADPYDITDHLQDGYYIFSLGRFFSMWREGACAENKQPYEQPFVAARPAEGKE